MGGTSSTLVAKIIYQEFLIDSLNRLIKTLLLKLSLIRGQLNQFVQIWCDRYFHLEWDPPNYQLSFERNLKSCLQQIKIHFLQNPIPDWCFIFLFKTNGYRFCYNCVTHFILMLTLESQCLPVVGGGVLIIRT